ncbi:hypothetical protein [Helicobacter sp. MIT 14-3879]|uniref:hypothetical protein n=1 Tax=Helicobacter sp. MIT 14-3879 TaxID=2040649 RepID=UPI0021615AAF|nr:hypothetical protein [Helicobacter sp. MIT 14-3879]
MNNKQQIQKLKENAELAWAAYGYFHLANKNYKPHKLDEDEKRLKYFREIKKKQYEEQKIDITDEELQSIYPTPLDILNIEYKYYKDDNGNDLKGLFDDDFLGGDMTPTQAKRFFSRYDLLIHQPNTTSGFSATLFEDLGELEKELDNKTNTRKSTTLFQDKESKEYTFAIRSTELKQGIFNDTQDNNQKIISIRGTEFPSGIFNDIAEADVSLALDSLSNHQYIDMLRNLL